MFVRFSDFAVLAIAAIAMTTDLQSAPAQAPVTSPGFYTLTLTRTDGPPVRYAIYIPDEYSPPAKIPLVLALHFGANPTTGAGRALLEILVAPVLSDLGAIIVAPDSLGGGWETAENDRAVVQLLDAVIAGYSIDPRRVVVTGFSMGGRGTWHFGAKYPQRFSGAIPMAGTPPASATDWRLPVFAIHSRNDQVVPIGPTETRINQLKAAGVRAELVVLSGIAHHETYRFADGLRRAIPWLRDLWKGVR